MTCTQNTHTHTVTLRFHTNELIYDISNMAYVEAHIMPEDALHIRHVTADIAQEGNIDRVNRMFNLIFSEVREMLYPFTKTTICNTQENKTQIIDNKTTTHEYQDITLSIPESMSNTTINHLSTLIHEYTTYRVLAHWLSITNQQAAQRWTEKAELTKTQILKAKHMRRSTYQRKFSVI